jgi:hypothetical protein
MAPRLLLSKPRTLSSKSTTSWDAYEGLLWVGSWGGVRLCVA